MGDGDFRQRPRSQRHVTYPGKIAVTQYRVVVSSSYWAADMSIQLHTRELTLGRPPTNGAQNGWHGKLIALLHVMIDIKKHKRLKSSK